MARIRTVKPELFRHERLFEVERETGLPLRLAWIGLFTVADRAGRFEWKPNVLKLDIMPFDEIDFSRVLDALASRGFLVKYAYLTKNPSDGVKVYGCIPTFGLHQVINNKEQQSKLPGPEEGEQIPVDFDAFATRTSRVTDACPTPLSLSQGEKEGKGKGRGRGREENLAHAIAKPEAGQQELLSKGADPEGPSSTALTWRAYKQAYETKYREAPVWNGKVAGQFRSFVARVPADEAPEIAAFYLTHGDQFYSKSMHSVGLLLRDAEKLRTEWATGRKVTTISARGQELVDHARDQIERISRGDL